MSSSNETSPLYNCETSEGFACAADCVSLAECATCQCAVVDSPDGEDPGGPGGSVGDFFLILLPIIILIVLTVKKNPWPTTWSLPFSALLMFLVRTMYLGSNPLQTCAAVILGLHEALTPLSIMAGAIFLFESMEATYCLPFMMREIKQLTAGHPISEAMLIFAFAYMVEGASGFGTPAALGAPMLVSTGHDPLASVVTLLLFNTFATVWGAVGTPLWFGFGELGLSEQELIQISYKAAVALTISGVFVIPFILTVLVPLAMVRRNLGFVFLSILVTMGPMLGLSFYNYEFPSLIGSMIGCGLTATLIHFNVGLRSLTHEDRASLKRDVQDIASVCENSVVMKPEASINQEGLSSSQLQTSHSYQKSASNVSEISMIELPRDLQQPEDHEESDKDNEDPDAGGGKGGHAVVVENGNANFPIRGKMVSFSEKEEESEAAGLETQRDVLDEILGPRPTGWNYIRTLLMRTFPIWGVVLLLILTRVQQIGIKPYLLKLNPAFEIYFGTYGLFRLSVSIVFQLRNILAYPNMNWDYELLYVPFIIPFIVISYITIFVYRKNLRSTPKEITMIVVNRLIDPAIALMGALVLVQLMIKSGQSSPAYILGVILAQWLRQGFVVICPLLGALGSFFSGSTTVSNLTFGDIQQVAAEAIGVSQTSMLALQAVGASAGNGICLNNIIAASAVVGLTVGEGQVLMYTAKYVFGSTTICTIVMLAFFMRFN